MGQGQCEVTRRRKFDWGKNEGVDILLIATSSRTQLQ